MDQGGGTIWVLRNIANYTFICFDELFFLHLKFLNSILVVSLKLPYSTHRSTVGSGDYENRVMDSI